MELEARADDFLYDRTMGRKAFGVLYEALLGLGMMTDVALLN